jgi:hypothetical protein
MKFIFKKYLDFEIAHGDEDKQNHVKTLGEEYCNKANMSSELRNESISIEENLKKNLNFK